MNSIFNTNEEILDIEITNIEYEYVLTDKL